MHMNTAYIDMYTHAHASTCPVVWVFGGSRGGGNMRSQNVVLCRAMGWRGGYEMSNWVPCNAVARTRGYVGPKGPKKILALFLGG